jgi:RNA recognition motif-containing protein
MLTSILDSEGFAGFYDFLYMPMNFRTKASFGYAFVNIVTPEHAYRFCEQFQGFTRWGVPTDKVCDVSWSNIHQGLAAHIERYRNSPVMHESVPDEYKPVMYNRGVRVPFPPPTKNLRMPRIRKGSVDSGDKDDQDDDQAMPPAGIPWQPR